MNQCPPPHSPTKPHTRSKSRARQQIATNSNISQRFKKPPRAANPSCRDHRKGISTLPCPTGCGASIAGSATAPGWPRGPVHTPYAGELSADRVSSHVARASRRLRHGFSASAPLVSDRLQPGSRRLSGRPPLRPCRHVRPEAGGHIRQFWLRPSGTSIPELRSPVTLGKDIARISQTGVRYLAPDQIPAPFRASHPGAAWV